MTGQLVTAFQSRLANLRTLGMVAAALIGAVFGAAFAWLLGITGHPSWSALLLIFCAIAPSMMIAEHRSTFWGWIRWRASPELKVLLTLLLVALTLLVLDALNVNPRDHAYLPLLLPIILIALLLGIGAALVGVLAGIVIADCVYAPPPYCFAITEWKNVAGLAVFAVLGAINAWIIREIVSFPRR
jgi:MFS family permease